MRCPFPKRKYISLVPSASCSATVSQGTRFPLCNTIAVQKPPTRSPEPVRASGLLDQSTLLESEPTRVDPQTVRAMLRAGWPALLAALSFLLATKLSDTLFGDVLSALQALARTAGCLAFPTPHDAFLTMLAKAALSTRVVAALDELPQAQQTPHFPVSLEALTLGLASSGGSSRSRSGAGLSPRNPACLRALRRPL